MKPFCLKIELSLRINPGKLSDCHIYFQQAEYERMTKDVNRSAYTKRIMEIVANIKKQKMEIDKV